MMGYGDFGWMGASTGFWSRSGKAEPSPTEILRRRYAAGEITAAEFEQAKQAIA